MGNVERLRREPLLLAAAAFLAVNLLHTADHLRQGLDGLSWEILAGGTLITLNAGGAVVLAARRSPFAGVFAAAVGLSAAVGIAASHLAPHWGALSDSYPEIGVDGLSWAVVLLEIAGAIALVVAGMGSRQIASAT